MDNTDNYVYMVGYMWYMACLHGAKLSIPYSYHSYLPIFIPCTLLFQVFKDTFWNRNICPLSW